MALEDEFRKEATRGIEDEEVDDFLVVFVPHPDMPEGKVASGPFLTADRSNGVTRGILLKYTPTDSDLGLGTEQDESTFRPVSNSFGLYVASDLGIGVAIYLLTCEVSGIPEETVRSSFNGELGVRALQAYNEWQDTFTPSDRRLRLLDLAEPRRQNPLIDTALETGEFRSGTLSDSQQRFSQRLLSQIDPHSQKCYQNCINILDQSDFDDRLSYYEGILLPRQASRVLTHAWLEIDGVPFEVSLPWHRPSDSDAVYFGNEIPIDVVKDDVERTMKSRGDQLSSPYSITEEEEDMIRSDPGSPNV